MKTRRIFFYEIMDINIISYPALDFLFDDDQSLLLMNILVAGRTKRDKKPRIE